MPDANDFMKRKKKIVDLITKVFSITDPSGKNIALYKEKIDNMTDKEFIRFCKDGVVRQYIEACDNEVTYENAMRLCDELGTPLMEEITLPFLYRDPKTGEELIADKKAMCGPLTFKVLQQMVTKQKAATTDTKERDKFNQVTGEDKAAMLSDLDVMMLTAKGYHLAQVELLTLRADNQGGKEEAYGQLVDTGHCDIPESINDPKNKKTVQALYWHYIGAQIDSNLLGDMDERLLKASDDGLYAAYIKWCESIGVIPPTYDSLCKESEIGVDLIVKESMGDMHFDYNLTYVKSSDMDIKDRNILAMLLDLYLHNNSADIGGDIITVDENGKFKCKYSLESEVNKFNCIARDRGENKRKSIMIVNGVVIIVRFYGNNMGVELPITYMADSTLHVGEKSERLELKDITSALYHEELKISVDNGLVKESLTYWVKDSDKERLPVSYQVYDGHTNSYMLYNNMKLRYRCEVMVFNENFTELYICKTDDDDDDRDYYLPGGSAEPDATLEEQIMAETREEAGFNIKDLEYTGRSFIKEFQGHIPEWHRKFLLPNGFIYDGYYTELYIAKYESPIENEVSNTQDIDDFMRKNGKFYKFEDIADILRPQHMDIINDIVKNRR